MALRMWWLASALIASACHTALGLYVKWPGCSSSVETIEVGTLNEDVTDLYLCDCNLTTTDLTNLKYYPNLEVLFLCRNRISQIEVGTFDSFTKLSHISLHDNTFLGSNLPARLFQNWHLSHSVSIDFGSNDMKNTPVALLQGLDVYELNLNNCSLREIPSFVKYQVFQRMWVLQLKHNLISRLDDPNTFANIVNLEVLFIANNYIEFLNEDLLKPLVRIEAIYMSNNKIKSIPDGFFQNKVRLSVVDLADNLIEYLPASAFQGSSLAFLSVTGNRLSHLPVNFLSELQTYGVSLKVFYFDRNPWQFSCVNKILNEVKKQNIIYTGGHHAYQHKLSEDDSVMCE